MKKIVALHHSVTPSLHHSITPSLHHSITPSLHHSITRRVGNCCFVSSSRLSGNGQRELKDCTSGRTCLRPQPSSVSFDNRTADQESHSKALRLRCIEGIEKTVESARIQACTRISYCNQYMGSGSASRAFTGELAFVRFIGNLSNLL